MRQWIVSPRDSHRLGPSSLPAYSGISRDMRSVTGQTAQEVYAKKAAYADAFVQRPAFRSVYDGLSNAAYVAALLGPYNLTAITTTDPANLTPAVR